MRNSASHLCEVVGVISVSLLRFWRQCARLQLRYQCLHDLRGNRPTFDAPCPADIDADDAALQIDERAAAIGWLEDRVVLQDDGVAAASVAQIAPQAVLKL